MRWFAFKRRKRKSVRSSRHFVAHKEAARALVISRLTHYNQSYGFKLSRIAIRNQKRRWGSCTSLGNLNFNYRILFLPTELADYIIVHELCHLGELNHQEAFWNLVRKTIPNFQERKAALRAIERSVTLVK